jgi:hypothetical protein
MLCPLTYNKIHVQHTREKYKQQMTKIHQVKISPPYDIAMKVQKVDYSSAISLTSALDGVGGEHHAPAALPSGQTRYPAYRRLGETHGWSRGVRKISPLPGFEPRTPHAVDSHNTPYDIPVHKYSKFFFVALALRPNAGHDLLILEVSRSARPLGPANTAIMPT